MESAVVQAIPEFFTRFNKHLRTFDTSIFLGGIHVWLVWTVGFADIPLDVAIDLVNKIGSAPLQAFLSAVKDRISIPHPYKTKVIRADQAVWMCVEVVSAGAIDAGNLQFSTSWRIWKFVDDIRSRVKLVIDRFRVTNLLKKTVLKLWLLAVQMGQTAWNWASTGVAIVIIVSLLDRLDRGLLDNYFLQQKNPLVKDKRLGRRRSRVS